MVKWSLCNPPVISYFFPYIEMDGQVQESEYFLAGHRKFFITIIYNISENEAADRFADQLRLGP